jgi:diaminopimelate epimerase
MLKINFTKMQALGNDFVLIDARRKHDKQCDLKQNNLEQGNLEQNNIKKCNPTMRQSNLTTQQIKLICDRKLGIGCDQLLILQDNIESSPEYDYIYKIFNSDATEVEQCGNGARCCIKYLLDEYNSYSNTHQSQEDQYVTMTAPRIIRLKSINRIISGYAISDDIIAVNLGIPKFLPSDLPSRHQQLNSDNCYSISITDNINTENNTDNSITYGIVSVGNPHAVIKLNNLHELNNTANLTKIAKLLQQSELFPHSVNVSFYVIDSPNTSGTPDTIHLRTYERGCGFTDACGTGAAATVCYGIIQGLLNNIVRVNMLGGTLTIKWIVGEEIIMSGSTTKVFSGSIELK